MSPFNGTLLTGSLIRGHPNHHYKQCEIGELALHGPQFSKQQTAGVHTRHINHRGGGAGLQDLPLIPPRTTDPRGCARPVPLTLEATLTGRAASRRWA